MTSSALFTSQEIEAMLCSAPSAWWKAFIQLMANSGLRVQEALRLHRSDVCGVICAVRVTSDPTDDLTRPDVPSLRRWVPPRHERVIPVAAEIFDAIRHLCDEDGPNRHVFVPDWRLDELWPIATSGRNLSDGQLVPRLGVWFEMIQRRAHWTLARRSGRKLVAFPFPTRSIHALRSTAIANLSRTMSARQLAEHLGIPMVSSRRLIAAQVPQTERAA